ncbi:Hsp70 family protein [Streptomyces yangpuensis]|uniref:Hsp70 family protein n=1 Tax=Streptomyces yangpuensis TaxID=1648182 RepID=UPI0036C1091D
MIAIDLGHRYGRVARVGPDGRPEVTTTELAGVDGVLDPVRALPRLLGASGAGKDSPAARPDPAVLLGLPATGGREDELRYAVERAGLDVARVVPEPVAAALHYRAVADGVDHTVLVCDLGATTLDLSVLAITPDRTVHVVRALGLQLGGDVFDAAVATELTGRLPEGTDPLRAARTLRESLDGPDATTAPGVDAAGEHRAPALDRAVFERAVAPLREHVLEAVTEQLTSAEPAVDTVLLAGGMGAVPWLRAGIEALPAARGLAVRCDRPGLAVVLGLLSLQDFGVLRIVAGAPAQSARSGSGYPGRGAADERPHTEPSFHATDPEPRPARPPAEDPEPGGQPGGKPGAFEPPEPETAGGPYAGAPRTEEPPYAGPGPAEAPPAQEPPYTGTPRTEEPPYAGTPRTEEPPYAGTPRTEEPPYAGTPRAEEPLFDAPSPAETSYADPPESGAAFEPRALFAVPVDQLQYIRRGDHLLVLWAWPEGSLSARVRWRRDGGGTAGTGPDDGDVVCRRRVYEHDGGFDLPVGRGAVTLTVEALVPELRDGCEGASSLLVPAEPVVVTYEATVRRRLKGRIASVTFTAETGCDLPGLRIVHSIGSFRPTSTADGEVLHEVPAQRLSAGTPLSVEFPLPATRGPSWLYCFPADASTESGIHIRPTALHRLRVP